MKRMQGYDVLHPMGFDAFGLPAEQYALKNKVNPNISTAKNVARYKEQLQMLGLDYDWDREINTTDPKFYKWTQWMWKQMYKKGLAHESYDPINWCPSCKTGLANEDLENGLCERCGSVVEKKPLRQWTIRITDYADRLLEDLDKLDWEPHIKELQRNWIGKSEGSEITFTLQDFAQQESLTVFTTRADTLCGATFMAISFDLAKKWIEQGWKASDEVVQTISQIEADAKKQDFSFKEVLEKKGVDTGIRAVNPSTGEVIPVWIANYILSGYGTGAIMAVPAHDERDHGFAKQYNLPIREVINPVFIRDDVKDGVLVENKQKIVAIVENTDGKILCINWGEKMGGKLFLGGTIENNEAPEVTAIRELKEETGYNDAEVVSVSKETFIYTYYAFSKEKYYCAKTKFVHIKLKSNSQVATTLEADEKDKFKVEWLSKEEASTVVTEVLHKRAYDLLVLGLIYSDNGVLYNSGEYDGLTSQEAKIKITEAVGGKLTSQYRLKDWVFARQRYWGEPFPIVFDENHQSYVVADKELPVVLPMVDEYEPAGTGESPLANISDWVEVYGYINGDGEFESLPHDDLRAKKFKRETNTMPQWAGSSWYYLRYIDPHNDLAFIDPIKEEKWSPVDFYVGGAEHATRHLIYARFWHKFLFDLGLVSRDEPFTKLQTVGLIMAEDGRKMSKRWGNIVNPDDVVAEYGADTLRLYEMFMGPFDQSVAWSTSSIKGSDKFLDKVHGLSKKIGETSTIDSELHKTIKKVGEDIDNFKFNTAISAMMILSNAMEAGSFTKADYQVFLKLLAPFAPHLTEQLWSELGETNSIHKSPWPTYDESKLLDKTVTLAIQITGKMRGTIEITRDSDDATVLEAVKKHEMYKKYVGDAEPKKIIIVKNKIANIVI
jgi:leucyl-tRNA synthetase